MTAWSTFYDFVMPDVPGISTSFVDFMLRQVAIDFCRKSCLHSVELDAIDVVADQQEYDLTSPIDETEVALVKAAWFNNTPMMFATLDVLNPSNPYWPSLSATDARAFTQRQPDKMLVYPIPDTDLAGGLRVEVVLVPTQSAAGLTDWIANKYRYELACGVKARLMLQPSKPWTNLEAGQYELAQYQAALTRATIDTNRSLTRAAVSAAMRPAA